MAENHPLDFEKELYALEDQLEVIRNAISEGDLSRKAEFVKLESKVTKLRAETYGKLTP